MYTNINIADGRAHKIDILLAVACLLYCHKIAEDIAMIKILHRPDTVRDWKLFA